MSIAPIIVTSIAGLSTVIGAALIKRVRNTTVSACSLAFATGIMLMVALGELIPEAFEVLGETKVLVLFAAGACLSLVLDLVLPHHHEHDEKEEVPGHYLEDCECVHGHELSHSIVIALVLHNVLEGFATGATVVSDFALGITMAIGIAIHNIPIGTTLAVSAISAGKSRGKALGMAALVGLSQPLGALVGLLCFGSSVSQVVLSVCMSIVAGILVFISFDELWPAAKKGGSRNITIIALIVGICFIPLTEKLVG